MKIKKADIPTGCLTANYLPADYSDVFFCEVDSERKINPDDIMISFWSDFPGWVNALFKLRNFLVKFVGLKGSQEKTMEELEKCIRTRSSTGLASVPAKNNNETVLLLTDKHLNAYLSVYIENNKSIFVITLVHYKNKLGRIYFFFVRPFHGLIVRSMLKRSIHNLSKK